MDFVMTGPYREGAIIPIACRFGEYNPPAVSSRPWVLRGPLHRSTNRPMARHAHRRHLEGPASQALLPRQVFPIVVHLNAVPAPHACLVQTQAGLAHSIRSRA